MKLRLFLSLVGPLAIIVQAAELAPASAQYSQEGEASAPAPAAPKVFPRKIWPRVELTDGRILERVRVSAEDGGSVTLVHSEGMSKVDKRVLPAEMAAQYPYSEAVIREEAARAAERRKEARLEQAERRAEAREARAEEEAEERRSRVTRQRQRASVPREATGHTVEAIDAAARQKARAYFETEKRTGSGATLVFQIFLETDTPTEIAGWPNQWEVNGTASYKVYDSYGGAFSNRAGKKFRATVEAAPGKKIRILDFEER